MKTVSSLCENTSTMHIVSNLKMFYYFIKYVELLYLQFYILYVFFFYYVTFLQIINFSSYDSHFLKSYYGCLFYYSSAFCRRYLWIDKPYNHHTRTISAGVNILLLLFVSLLPVQLFCQQLGAKWQQQYQALCKLSGQLGHRRVMKNHTAKLWYNRIL